MKKISLLICVAMLTAAAITFAQTSPDPSPPATGSPGAQKYTCPMHPEIERDTPGKCPKCGMKLEPKKEVDKKK